MEFPAIPECESRRIQDLERTRLLDTLAEPQFDQYTQFASILFDVPISLISLVGAERQWFKSNVGLSATETSREVSFCAHAILDDAPLIVPDSRLDDRFYDNPIVVDEPHVIFYAGKPIVGKRGYQIGTICLIDHKARILQESEIDGLMSLAKLVSGEVTRSMRAMWDEEINISNKRGFKLLCDIAAEILEFNLESIRLVEFPLPLDFGMFSSSDRKGFIDCVISNLDGRAVLGKWDSSRLFALVRADSHIDCENSKSFEFAPVDKHSTSTAQTIVLKYVDWNEVFPGR